MRPQPIEIGPVHRISTTADKVLGPSRLSRLLQLISTPSHIYFGPARDDSPQQGKNDLADANSAQLRCNSPNKEEMAPATINSAPFRKLKLYIKNSIKMLLQ